MKKFGFPRVFAQLARHSIVKPFLLVTICWQDGPFYAIVRCCFRNAVLLQKNDNLSPFMYEILYNTISYL